MKGRGEREKEGASCAKSGPGRKWLELSGERMSSEERKERQSKAPITDHHSGERGSRVKRYFPLV